MSLLVPSLNKHIHKLQHRILEYSSPPTFNHKTRKIIAMTHCVYQLIAVASSLVLLCHPIQAFLLPTTNIQTTSSAVLAISAAKGFGSGGSGDGFGASSSSKNKSPPTNKKVKKKKQPKVTPRGAAGTTYVKSEQEDLLRELAQQASSTCIGRAVAEAPPPPAGEEADPFWELMPSLINSRFPNVADSQLERIAGVIRHTLNPKLPLEDEIVNNPHRPQDEIHAYMPGLGPTKPFHDPSQLDLCKQMSENYETILHEYLALINDMEHGGKDRFQSVTSMNYKSGWKTLVLFYNGHRIEDFPYHLCPVTTRILESVPLAGRIAGFNRQQPQTGIPLHTDGNNMWLTCQMGIKVPDGKNGWHVLFIYLFV